MYLLEDYSFDKQGRISSYKSPMGDKTTFKYDKSGNLQEVKSPEGSIHYGYDENGNRIWMNDNSGITEYYYDAFDRLISVITEHSPRFFTRYRYDHRNNIIEIGIINLEKLSLNNKFQDLMQELNQRFQLNLQKHHEQQRKLSELLNRLQNESLEQQWKLFDYQVKYLYDPFNRLTEIDNKGKKIHYTYYVDQHQVIRQYPDNIQSVFSFAPEGRLLSVRHENYKRDLIKEFKISYDFAGRIGEITEQIPGSIKTIRYEWDNRNFLTSERHSDGSQIRYEYNSEGRLITTYSPLGAIQYRYDNFKRLIQAGDIQFLWNKNNLILKVSGENVNTRFAYDSWGNLVKIETLESSVQFSYDGEGNQISITSNNNEVIHTVPNQFNGDGSTLAEFNQTGDMVVKSNLYGYGLTGQINENGETEYFLEDTEGQLNQMVDLNGGIIPYALNALDYSNQKIFPEIITNYFVSKYVFQNVFQDVLQNSGVRQIALNAAEKNAKLAGKSIGALFAFAEPLSRHIGGWLFAGGPFITGDEALDYSLAGAKLYTGWQITEAISAIGITASASVPSVAIAVAVGIGVSIIFDQIAKGWGKMVYSLGYQLFLYLDQQATKQSLVPSIANLQRQRSEDIYIPMISPGTKSDQSRNKKKRRRSDMYPFFSGDDDDDDDDYPPPPPPPPPPGGDDDDDDDDGGGSNSNSSTGGDGSGSNFRYTLENTLADPINKIEMQLGGIELALTADFRGIPGNIIAAVYDPENEYLVLVGEQDYSVQQVKPEDFAVALALAFSTPEQIAQFSLDPADRKNPEGEWLKAVYLPENILAGSAFGDALYEADWLLKQYSFGVYIDKNKKLQPRESSVTGYRNVAELSFEREGNDKEARWARYWIVSDKMILRKSGNSIVFDEAKMAVNARSQVVDPSSETGLRDVQTGPNEIPSVYAKQFTRLYDDIGREEPAFRRVTELAKTVALAKWLKKENIPVDMEWMVEFINHRKEYVTKVRSLNYQWNKENEKTYQEGNKIVTESSTRSLHLFGGVDLTVNPEYRADNGETAVIEKAVFQHLNGGVIDPVFEINVNDQTYFASIVPFAGKGKQLWNGQIHDFAETPGTNYNVSDEGKLIKKIDQEGTRTDYGYDEAGNLNIINIQYNNGTLTKYQKNKTGSSWTHIKSNGSTLEYNYDSKGYLTNINVDGEVFANYSYDLAYRQIEVHFPEYDKILIYDEKGRCNRQEIKIYKPGSSMEYQPYKFEYRYDSKGNISYISGDGMQPVNIENTGNKEQIAKLTTPELTIEYFYDEQGRLVEIKRSDKNTIKFLYGEGEELTIKVEEDGQQTEYLSDENGLNHSSNVLGEIVDYEYENGKLISVKSNQFGNTKLYYNRNKSLKQIQLPDGRSIVYNYLPQNNLVSSEKNSNKGRLHISMHPAKKSLIF